MSKSPFVITISGDPVAGKSSAIAALTEKYEQDGFYIGERDEGKCVIKLAAGQMFRNIAIQSGIELQTLNDFAKQPGNTIRKLKEIAPNSEFFGTLSEDILDKSVDAFIDEYMLNHIEMLKTKYADKDDVLIIVDSRIAGLLMRNLGRENMGIRFSIQPAIAAERLVKDAKNRQGEINIDNKTEEEAYNIALESVELRRSKERERFIKTYSKNPFDQAENAKVDLRNLQNYNLVIDTSGATIPNEVAILHSCIEKAREGKSYDTFWRSTKYVYPGSVTKEDIDPSKEPRIQAIKVDGQYYALHGQEYVGIGNRRGYEFEQKTGEESGYPLLPVDLVAKKQQFIFDRKQDGNIYGFQADLYVHSSITKEFVENFEREYSFKYPERGVAKLPTVKEVRDEARRNSGIGRG